MEQEIDDLFKNGFDTDYTEASIDELENSASVFDSIRPYANIIHANITNYKMNYDLYDIKLERLAKEMQDIEKENTKLENQILYQTSIYKKLKDLIIRLEINEENFINLETGNFDSIEEIVKMEQACDILLDFKIEDYTIRVVKEKKERIDSSLNKFFERLRKHIAEICKNEKPKGFHVHSSFYEKLGNFKKFFEMAKYFEAYTKICKIYCKTSRNLYEKELQISLKILYQTLLENNHFNEIHETIQVILQSYKSIIEIENKFLKKNFIDTQISEIFKNINSQIFNFFGDLYLAKELEIILILSDCFLEIKETDSVYFNLQEGLKILFGKFKKSFLQKEAELKDEFKGIERFEENMKFLQENCKTIKEGNQTHLQDFTNFLYKINLNRITRNKPTNIYDVVNQKYLLNRLNLSSKIIADEYNELQVVLNKDLEKFVIDYVCESKNPINQVQKLSRNIKANTLFKKEIFNQIYEIAKGHLSNKEIEMTVKVFEISD